MNLWDAIFGYSKCVFEENFCNLTFDFWRNFGTRNIDNW